MRARDESRRRVSELQGEIAVWEEEARELLRAAGRPVDGAAGGEPLAQALADLHDRLEKDTRTRDQCAALEKAIEETDARLEAEKQRLAEAEAARDALFTEAGARDEAEFRSRLEIYERRQELRRRIEDREHQIVAQIGRDEKAAAIREQLATGHVEAWRGDVREADRCLTGLREARDDAIRRHSEAQRARQKLEESADTAKLEAMIEALRQELALAVAEWRVAAIARGLVEETLRTFTRTRQPAVLAEASKAFAMVTNGHYEEVVQGDGETLQILDRHGGVKLPDELSRGTAEQLYLCLRLGLAAEFARRTSLPLVMDDVLVNFDPERARAVAELLLDCAGEHQVLIFTCHPETAALLVSLEPATRVFAMDRHEGATALADEATSDPETLQPD
jgi:uncharacterized protein YhaN